jgi:hypothetical protein
MYLKGGTKDHFLGFLRAEFPQMVDAYDRLYAGAYASPDYAGAVRALIEMLQEKHDVARRLRRVTVRHEAMEEEAEPEQERLRW